MVYMNYTSIQGNAVLIHKVVERTTLELNIEGQVINFDTSSLLPFVELEGLSPRRVSCAYRPTVATTTASCAHFRKTRITTSYT